MLIRAEFKKEIANSNWVNERISEVFDDATEMMSENSIIYGGAIRDALAEKELSGDIDIAVSVKEYDSVIAKFRHSVKWISKNGPLGTKNQDYRIWLSKLFNVSSFIHMNGNVAQVIAVNTKDVCSIVRDVDIVCCAVIMTSDGHVFEVVDGAYDDCVAKVLRLNKTKNIVNINDTPERIKKLTGRGWKSLITDKQIERAVSKYKKSAGIATNQSKLMLHDHSGRPIKKHGNGPYGVSGRLSVPEGSRKNISIIEKSRSQENPPGFIAAEVSDIHISSTPLRFKVQTPNYGNSPHPAIPAKRKFGYGSGIANEFGTNETETEQSLVEKALKAEVKNLVTTLLNSEQHVSPITKLEHGEATYNTNFADMSQYDFKPIHNYIGDNVVETKIKQDGSHAENTIEAITPESLYEDTSWQYLDVSAHGLTGVDHTVVHDNNIITNNEILHTPRLGISTPNDLNLQKELDIQHVDNVAEKVKQDPAAEQTEDEIMQAYNTLTEQIPATIARNSSINDLELFKKYHKLYAGAKVSLKSKRKKHRRK